MSININNAENFVRVNAEKEMSDDNFRIIVEDGSTSSPRSLKIDASSIIIPNNSKPAGAKGSMFFDNADNIMKYYDGFKWISWVNADDIKNEVDNSLEYIKNELKKKVDTVKYTTAKIPSASISGTTLNIVFPTLSDGGGEDENDIPGLFTSLPTGSITYYSLSSGMNYDDIREQLGGETGSQVGRTGTQDKPFKTKTGWVLADGKYWEWKGHVTKNIQVPNLNQNNYLKSISEEAITKDDIIITASGTLSDETVKTARHYHGVGERWNGNDLTIITGKVWNDGNSYYGHGVPVPGSNASRHQIYSGNASTALSTSLDITEDGATSKHTHSIMSMDVDHLRVAILYNIAEPLVALNEHMANERFVKLTGDVMTGSLDVKNNLSIYTDDTYNILKLNNLNGNERAAFYHDKSNNTTNIRSTTGEPLVVYPSGKVEMKELNVKGKVALVDGKQVLTSVNGQIPDENGNISLNLNLEGPWNLKNGTTYTAEAITYLMMRSSHNTTVVGVINGAEVLRTDGRSKYGQGKCSVTMIIPKGATYKTTGADRITKYIFGK